MHNTAICYGLGVRYSSLPSISWIQAPSVPALCGGWAGGSDELYGRAAQVRLEVTEGMSNRKRFSYLPSRDGHLCGIHVGGCGKNIRRGPMHPWTISSLGHSSKTGKTAYGV